MINAILWTLALAAADLKPQVTGGTQAAPLATPALQPTPAGAAVLNGQAPVANPGQPTVFPGLVQQQQAQQQKKAEQDAKNQQMNQLMQQMMSAMGGGGGANAPSRGDSVPEGTDYSTYEYPDDFRFQSGQRGAGNIGNGLCTAKNMSRTQVTKGYCRELANVLGDENSCAGKAMRDIARVPGQVKDLNQWCPNFSQMTRGPEQQNVFMQVLSTLITQESGWNAGVTEGAWRAADGSKRQGKGLFQIGEWDHDKDADCAGINISSIYDAKTNIKCGACIAMKNIAKDMAMGSGSNDWGSIGMARYFGPLRDLQSSKRAAMQGAVREYCLSSKSGGNAPVGNSNATK